MARDRCAANILKIQLSDISKGSTHNKIDLVSDPATGSHYRKMSLKHKCTMFIIPC